MLSVKHFRFLAMATLTILAVALAAALPGVSADGGVDKNEEAAQGQEQAVSIPEKAGLSYLNLGSHLDQLVASVEAGQATAQDAAAATPVHSGESVAVTIYLSGNVDEVVSFLEDNGGDPRNVGEDYIEAYVPVTLLGAVSEQPGVIRVREIVPPQPAQTVQRITGHGPAVHGSPAWNQAGYSGQGVKVGVIDLGFRGLTSLMGTELPATVHARCYTDIGMFTENLADCEAVEPVPDTTLPECRDAVQRRAVEVADHGTIVAESVLDIAPEVELYISQPGSRADLQDASEWMASQGVSVINYSVGWIFDGPGDGTSPSSISPLNTVDQSVSSGVIWVNSAGNSGQAAWFGGYSNPDGDRAVSFGGQNDEVMDIPVRECRAYTVQLRWEDTWEGASTDLDLYFYNKNTGDVVFSSEGEQSGETGHVPYERFSYRFASDSNDYGLVVSHHGGDAPAWIQVMVWGTYIEHYTRNGSIGNPGESANLGMLAVGAAHWNDVHTIEPYSSRGPTPDGRVNPKPDIVGADCGVTARSPLDEYNDGFCGTSQASPHVAGMAALVRQRFPSYTPAQVASYLKDNAEQRRSPDPNDTWGHGFAQLPPPDGTATPVPVPSNVFTWNQAADFNTLADASNRVPRGIWSDGETMWVADIRYGNEKIYAYDMATKARVSSRDFDNLTAAGNTLPFGIWSDGEIMWVADLFDEKIYAYDMATKARVSDNDFDNLQAAGNTWPTGIWSDGETMWVADWIDDKIYAYDMATKGRVSGRDFNFLKAARNFSPIDIWSDGMTMWVVDTSIGKVYAYDMATAARVPGREFNTLEAAGNLRPRGIWSDGTTTWVSDSEDAKIYAYHTERDALVAIYSATGGADWTNRANWLTDELVGQWHGVNIDANGRVSSVDLQNNALSGQIPAELVSLTNLEQLRLNDNQLTGEIPAGLGRLENLTLLHLSGNQLTGCVPAALMDVEDNDFAQLGLAFCAPAAATRSFSATTVAPDRQVTVTITAADYGDSGQVSETLPPGFAYVSSSLSEGQATATGQTVQEVRFALSGETSFTYAVTASSSEAPYTFSGTLRDSEGNDHPVGGDATVTVSLMEAMLAEHDANENGRIDRSEAIAALRSYLSGDGSVTREEVIAVLRLYLGY